MRPLPHTSSWRGALLIKHRDNFPISVVKDHLKRIKDQNGFAFNLVLKHTLSLERLEYKMHFDKIKNQH
jgi:hypothetical protein